MTVKHVLNDQLAMGYAAGALPEAFDIVVAAHLSLSDESRALVSSYEAVGACVMEECDSVELKSDAFAATLGRIKSSDTVIEKPGPKGVLPEPIQKYLGGDLEKSEMEILGRRRQTSDHPDKRHSTGAPVVYPSGAIRSRSRPSRHGIDLGFAGIIRG